STHLIAEWEGLIDEFTIVEKGRARITMETEQARQQCRRIHARWAEGVAIPEIPADLGQLETARNSGGVGGARGAQVAEQGQPVRLLTTSYPPDTETRLRDLGAE